MDVFVIRWRATVRALPRAGSGCDSGVARRVRPDDHGELDSLTSRDAWRRLFDKWRSQFANILRSVEQRQYRTPAAEPPVGWLGRMQERMLAWVAERLAEQRLLWNLRNQTAAVAVHPQDMTFEQVMTLITRKLQRDYERHRLWLIIDTVGMVVPPLVVIPGPNVLLYYW
jgi:hypothetical protein